MPMLRLCPIAQRGTEHELPLSCSAEEKLLYEQGAVTTITAGQPTTDFTACFAMFYGAP